MFSQEQEERDYFPQNELRNAYDWNCMNRKPDDTEKLIELVAQGRFVAYCEFPEYCPTTDALMGYRTTILGEYATFEEADAEARKWHNSLEFNCGVQPQRKQPSEPEPDPTPADFGEIPF